MNTKKIWFWSFVLGSMVAIVAYVILLPKQSVETASNVEAAEDELPEEEVIEEEPNFHREMENPMAEISVGKRAISIYVDVVPGVSGYVEPESQVDVIAYETSEDRKEDKKFKSAVLILENVRVLASGKSVDTEAEALHYQSVTLEVTPEQGVMVGLASKDKDGLYLMLRNEADAGTGKQGIKQTREIIEEDKGDK